MLFLAPILGTCLIAAAEAPNVKPRIVVLIIIDQFGSDYIGRYRSFLSGGIKRMMEEGIYLPTVSHRHFNTETCPGHASIATGMHPKHHGITGNELRGDSPTTYRYCIDSGKGSFDPENLLTSSLPDWVRANNSAARIWSISGKDRAAIMFGGKNSGTALWYNRAAGTFSTSPYYGKRAQDQITSLNLDTIAAHFGDWIWTPLSATTRAIAEKKSEDTEAFLRTQSHPYIIGRSLPKGGPELFDRLYVSPALDEATISAARILLEREHLGQRDTLDYLAISLSSLDVIGHRFGPESPQTLDTLLRADALVGELISYLDKSLGREHYIAALTADHGIPPLPEWRQQRGLDAHRKDHTDIECIRAAEGRVRRKFHAENALLSDYLVIDDREIARLNLSRTLVLDELKREIRSCPRVERVDSGDPAPNDQSDISVKIRNGYSAARSPDLFITYTRYTVNNLNKAVDHGTPYDYDSDVPLMIMGGNLKAKQISTVAETVDIAPTLAAILRLKHPPVNGKPLHLD